MKIALFNTEAQVTIGGPDDFRAGIALKDLIDYMVVKAEVSHFSKSKWNGNVYFVDKNGRFKIGLLPYVVKWGIDNGVIPTIIDRRVNAFQFNEDFEYRGMGYDLYPEQREVIDCILDNKVMHIDFWNGIMKVATNGGKTVMADCLVSNTDAKALLLCDSSVLFEQHYNDFSEQRRTGKFNASQQIDLDAQMTIAMKQTFVNRLAKDIDLQLWANEFQILFLDESHKVRGKLYKKLLKYLNPYATIFMSGTPLGMDSRVVKMTAISQAGPIFPRVITNKELIDLGRSQRPIYKVWAHLCSYSPVFIDSYRKNIVRSSRRLQIIQDLIDEGETGIFVTVDWTEQGDYLERKLKGAKIRFIQGSDKDREEV